MYGIIFYEKEKSNDPFSPEELFSGVEKMQIKELKQNEIYSLIDEDFLKLFNEEHREYIKRVYYNKYIAFCEIIGKKPCSFESFFSNMHRRHIQMYQTCCPFCGYIAVEFFDKTKIKDNSIDFCRNCGRDSLLVNFTKQTDRFMRIQNLIDYGLAKYKENHPNTSEIELKNDCIQMEITELASIIEVFFRDYFEALTFIKMDGSTNSFIKETILKSANNDFMNIEKANPLFKKAFGIDLKNQLKPDIWNDLVDIANIRNMMVHNNGKIDKRFKESKTYLRNKDKIIDNMIILDNGDIIKYYANVIPAVIEITKLYVEEYYAQRNRLIANYYYNQI